MHYPHHHATPHAGELHVICPITNPQRYHSRYRHFDRFRGEMHAAGVVLHVIEAALGERPHECFASPDFPGQTISLQTRDELWHKERLINLAIERLPPSWKYVAWIDGDISFVRPDWAHETVQMLQHHPVIQLFQTAADLGPDGETMAVFQGFVHSWQSGRPRPKPGRGTSYGPWHPGFAWAARRDAIDALGGLFDTAILGSGDHHMAWALLGEAVQQTPMDISDGYRRALARWEDRATRHIRQNIGFVKGTITHHWHGKKRDRRYADRWEILLRHGYDPETDIKPDWQGLWAFSDQGDRMRNDIRAYFRARNEDSIDHECPRR